MMIIIIIIKSKSTSFGLALVRRQAFLEGRQVWCIYCFIGQAVPLSYRPREKTSTCGSPSLSGEFCTHLNLRAVISFEVES